MLKRTELLTELIRVRAELQQLLDDLSETHMLAPGALGTWSVRDVLAHLTAWEVDMLTNLGRVKRGAKPGTTRWTQATIQKQNETWHAEMRDRPLNSVLADFDGARKQTLRVLEGLSDQEAAKPVDWLQGRSLAEYVAELTLNHEREHLEHLRQWRGESETEAGAQQEPNGRGPRAD
jgi:hypothetical protein